MLREMEAGIHGSEEEYDERYFSILNELFAWQEALNLVGEALTAQKQHKTRMSELVNA